MTKNTGKNRERMVARIVEDMDIDALIEFARDQHEMFYEDHTDEEFEKVWNELFEGDT